MSAKDDLTLEYVRECLTYDPDTGEFRWRQRPLSHFATARGANVFNTQYAGTEAGCIQPRKRTAYRRIRIDGCGYKAHRLAWLLHHGEWPSDQIDHLDGDGLNNRIDNLRVVSNRVNNQNKRMQLNNTSGVTGVLWAEDKQKWRAVIWVDGRRKHLGYYDTFEEAVAARLEAEQKYGYTERHGLPEVDPAAAFRRLYNLPSPQPSA